MEFCENCKKIIDARINELQVLDLQQEERAKTTPWMYNGEIQWHDELCEYLITQLEYLRDVFAKGMK